MTPEDLARDLIAAGITARVASELRAPHLATRAARECTRLAGALVISLSPMAAKVPLNVERERLGGRDPEVLAELLERRYPPPPDPDADDLDARGGAS